MVADNESSSLPPLSLYVHLPWCVKKCPYCDFNSHALPDKAPLSEYTTALKRELDFWCPQIGERPIFSIFIGGGTPSLFPSGQIEDFMSYVRQQFNVDENLEVTLEANPGTVDEKNFAGYFAAGVNRLSIGAQSFNDQHLKSLGRIH
ncbi:MAG: radical SAM protein, partial [Gammaproteobacteria bacterium]|nr:radical SAM protein [Gammaproteobacteria bacterium]